MDRQCATLSLKEVRTLATWNASHHWGGNLPFRGAILRAWGMREPLEAHRAMLAASAQHNHFAEVTSYLFQHVLVGHSRVDPEAAWRQYLADRSDPTTNKALGGLTDTARLILKEWARSQPEESFQTIFDCQSERYFWDLAEGFALGAPAGQDWPTLSDRLDNEAERRGYDFQKLGCETLAARWLVEDPIPALDWYADRISDLRIERLMQEPDIDPIETESVLARDPDVLIGSRDEMKLLLIRKLSYPSEFLYDSIPQFVEKLNTAGESDLAARAIEQFLCGNPDQLSLISRIKNPAEGERVLIRSINSLPLRPYPIESDEDRSTQGQVPIPFEALVRSTMEEMELSQDGIRQIEASLNHYRNRLESAVDEDWDDPFATRE